MPKNDLITTRMDYRDHPIKQDPAMDPTDPLQAGLHDVVQKLETYGTPAALAVHMADLGIRGWRGRAGSCAIAEYIRETVVPEDRREDLRVQVAGGEAWVYEVNEEVRVYDEEIHDLVRTETPYAHVSYGPVAYQFIDAFDGHEFPELERG